jgi:hypothetical protein
MSLTNASTDAMIKGFPNVNLPIVSAKGTHQELATIRSALKENYCSVSTTLGDGAYGYLGGLTNDPIYATIVPASLFTVPLDPDNPPIIETGLKPEPPPSQPPMRTANTPNANVCTPNSKPSNPRGANNSKMPYQKAY